MVIQSKDEKRMMKMAMMTMVMMATVAIYIYNGEVSVCHENAYFPYSKNLVVSMFLDTFVFIGFGYFS